MQSFAQGLPSSAQRAVPGWVSRAARRAFADRQALAGRVPAAFVPLLWDSDTDGPGASVQVRGDRRVLWFGTDGIGVELVIGCGAGRRRGITVRLMPCVVAEVGLQHPRGGRRPIPPQATGRFAADDVAPGLMRLCIRRAGRPALLCAWVNLD